MGGCPFLNSIEVVDRTRRRSPFEMLRAARALRQKRYDMAVIFDRSIRSAAVCFLAGVPKRIGFNVEYRRPLLTTAVAYTKGIPELDALLRLADAAGADTSSREMKLWVGPGEHAEEIGASYAVLAPAANEPEIRQWPVEHYTELGRELQSEGTDVVLLGAPSETDIAREVEAGVPGALNLAGRTTVRQALSLIAGAKLFVSGEIGLSHCAVALGTPSVIIHNPKKVFRWGHNTHRAVALSAPADAAYPLHWIEPDMVLAAARRVMSGEPQDTLLPGNLCP